MLTCSPRPGNKGLEATLTNHAQQPAEVVARCAQHRVQPVTLLALEMAAVHAVISLEVADDRLDGLAPLEQLSVLLADSLALAPVHDMHIRVELVDTPIAQIHERRRWL